MFNDLTAILLAAGDSTRLWPIVDKLFIGFLGEPLIQYPINQLKKIGITKFIIVGNNENINNCQKLINFNEDAEIKVVIQNNNLGMAGALITADQLLSTEKILVVGPSDIVEDYLFSDFSKLYRQDTDGIFVGKLLNDYEPMGFYSVTNNIVSDIIEKPSAEKLTSKIAAIVFDYFKNGKHLISAIQKIKTSKDDLYEKAKVKLISEGLAFKLLSYNGFWGYLKYPWHLLYLTSFFLSGIKNETKAASIDNSVKITGPVFIDDNVTILENVKLVGPAYIGKGTLIGQNSLVRESIIGQNSIIGFASEITRSYIGNNCWFHHNYIGDSVIMDNTAFGFGAVVANYRLDSASIKSEINGKKVNSNRTKLGVIIGKNSRIGVNAALMPGIKIGKNSFVGSSVSLSFDLPDNKFIELNKNNTRILENRIKNQKNKIEENRLKLKF